MANTPQGLQIKQLQSAITEEAVRRVATPQASKEEVKGATSLCVDHLCSLVFSQLARQLALSYFRRQFHRPLARQLALSYFRSHLPLIAVHQEFHPPVLLAPFSRGVVPYRLGSARRAHPDPPGVEPMRVQ
jgi:hypothetical protein